MLFIKMSDGSSLQGRSNNIHQHCSPNMYTIHYFSLFLHIDAAQQLFAAESGQMHKLSFYLHRRSSKFYLCVWP